MAVGETEKEEERNEYREEKSGILFPKNGVPNRRQYEKNLLF